MGNISILFNLNGVANASPVTLQCPTITISKLPFGPWAQLTTPKSVSGTVAGVPNPDQYQVGLFAEENTQQFLGGTSSLATVAADGSFSLAASQSAGAYYALLMTPDFASDYYTSTFPDGEGSVTTLPTPSAYPGQVLMEVKIPAALNRYINAGTTYNIPPEGAQSQMIQRNFSSQYLPDLNLNPTDPANFQQLWYQLQGQYSYLITATDSKAQPTGGQLLLALYIYNDQLFLMVGAWTGVSSTSPQFVSTVVVDWGVSPPSAIQLGCALTVLPANIQLSVDVVNVDSSAIDGLASNLAQVMQAFIESFFAFLLE